MIILLNGTRTHCLDVGEGAPIVALHSIPTSSKLFVPLIPQLPKYRLIAPDLLGQGRTEAPSKGRLDSAAFLRHLEAFLGEVAPETFHLMAHDFGAVLGLRWAADHLHRVRSLVVLSTTITPSTRIAWIYAGNMLAGRAGLRQAFPRTLQRATALSPQLLEEWVGPWTRRRLLRGLDHFSARHLRELRERLPAVTRPALIILGSDDRVFRPRHAESIRRALPNPTLVTIPRCGHWSPVDAAEEVAAHMRAFFQCHPAGQ